MHTQGSPRVPTLLIAAVAVLLAVAIFLAGKGRINQSPQPSPGHFSDDRTDLKVVASFYPLAYFADRVGGERVQVVNMVPQGATPHDWEPKTSDVRLLNQADIFVYNGAGFEPWVKQALGNLDNDNLVVVDTSSAVNLRRYGGDGTTSAFDPHIWLDPVLAQQQVQQVIEGMTAADPNGRAVYQKNAATLLRDLQALDQEYAALGSCPGDTVITSHDYIGYVAKRYGFEVISIMGLAPDSEPTPRQLAELISLVTERHIGYIFEEPLVSSRAAQVIAEEAGATILPLNPVEGLTQADESRRADYITLMRDNLNSLRLALRCD